ncbi:MAG: polysaccharide biosynthesis protein [Eubacteriales bacterium]|nr:polysaccharide biosynthesis protein [Eubacteriales bacterium]
MSSSNKGSLMRQASILAFAGIVVRAIGLLYRIPLSRIIGDLGNSYYGIAFNIYSMLLLLSGYSIPVAVSKITSGYLAQQQHRNAHKVFQVSMLFITVFGGLLALLLYAFAPLILPEDGAPAVYALRALAPTLFISGFIGVLQGYFQSRNNTLPTATAQILEQVVNAVTSIFFAFVLTRAVIDDRVETASLGALGGTLGTLCGVITAGAVLYFIYKLNQPYFQRQMRRDRTRIDVSHRTIFRQVFYLLLPVVLSTFIYNVVGILDQYIYYGIMSRKGWDAIQIGVDYGIYVGKVIPVANVPSALAYSVSVAALPLISAAYARKNKRELHYRINEGVNFAMLIAFPAAVGMFVLAGPIMNLLFSGTPPIGRGLLMIVSVNIVTMSYSTVLSGALQGIGKPKLALYAGIIAIGVNVVIIIPLLALTNLGVYGIVAAIIPHALVMGYISYRFLRRYTGFRQRFMRPVILPLIASSLMGLMTFAVYHIAKFIFRFNFPALLIAVASGIVIYLVLILKMNIVNLKDVRTLPGGRYFLRLLKRVYPAVLPKHE